MEFNKKRSLENQSKYYYGKHGSYGDKDLITYQAKIDRKLADDFENIRRSENRTRREMLEEFIEWSKYQYANRKGLLQFTED